MSCTETCTDPSKTTSKSTILLTPRKRKRLTSEDAKLEAPNTQYVSQKKDESLRDKLINCRKCTTHPLMELYKWTFNQVAVAPVRVRHVFEMDLAGTDVEVFYWMGRVPCRTVKLVGMVVGIDEFDDMTRYKLDDGTAVIDCDLKLQKHLNQPTFPKATSTKTASKESSKQTISRQDKSKMRPEPPKVFVGAILSVRGRIYHGRGTRYLRLEPGSFSISDSANNEPLHWMEVNRLCREYYYLPEPFVVPKSAEPKLEQASSSNDPASVIPSSPVSALSPTKSESSRAVTKSPRQPRLRHPSRLHSRDLTDITFRIYLKYYIDLAPPYCSNETTSIRQKDDKCSDPLSTPTPKSGHRRDSSCETPRPRKHPMSQKQSREDETVQYGFTLSYLRRVPVLAEMARAVVRAESKRREKEKIKREERKGSQSTQASKSLSKSLARSEPVVELRPKLVSVNTKRLFQKTIRDLYKDGNIIIWHGPARPYEHAAYANNESIGGSPELWKTNTKTDTQSSPASIITSSSVCNNSTQDDTDYTLSEPDENEESYLPVTPRTIAPFVMRALRNLTGQENISRKSSRKHRPPTIEELTLYLRKSDAQWDNLGSWDVQTALEWLQNDDQVFKAGDGRWAICS
ncbi:hypothetical protein ACEPAH_1770 [Sanghuangporus vaninii]